MGEVDDEMLKEVFAAYGTVTWSRVFESGSKPSKAAIVEFGDIEEAKWCVENLDGNIPQGLSTPVKVSFKRSNKGGSKGWGGGGGSYGKAPGGVGRAAVSLRTERVPEESATTCFNPEIKLISPYSWEYCSAAKKNIVKQGQNTA